jgi:hypothetical protein
MKTLMSKFRLRSNRSSLEAVELPLSGTRSVIRDADPPPPPPTTTTTPPTHAGSCIDGRLTSAWNWCATLPDKPFYHVFLLSGFIGFDGEFQE